MIKEKSFLISKSIRGEQYLRSQKGYIVFFKEPNRLILNRDVKNINDDWYMLRITYAE